MKNSGIQWTNHTFNPWIGCDKVSPGCKLCYAEAQDKRWKKGRWGAKAPRERTSPSYWLQPAQWNAEAKEAAQRARVFCASLADVFEDRDDAKAPLPLWRAQLFETIKTTPWLDWLLLTKRPENITRLWPYRDEGPGFIRWPNVWLGTTVEDQEHADLRLERLIGAPAQLRFLSVEPMLGPVVLRPDWLERIGWVICGGESDQGGKKARPFDVSWARTLRDQCAAAGVPFFMKQMGSNPQSAFPPEDDWLRKLEDSHGGEMEEWSEDLRVRQLPKAGSFRGAVS